MRQRQPGHYDWGESGGSQGGDCVEAAAHPAAAHIRDSQVTDGPVLTVPPSSGRTSHASSP
ncbi:DUF397 domain-containing protein [Streptomyces sp. 372A]